MQHAACNGNKVTLVTIPSVRIRSAWSLGTIRSKIVDLKLYEDDPPLLMFGMFPALFSANVMLYLATAFGYPMSTTHDIVGSIMGFSIAARGFDIRFRRVGRRH